MKTNDKIEVKKIDIKIGDNTISLKPEQAKELKKILNEMFEEQKVVHEHRYTYWWNYPTPVVGTPYSPFTTIPYWTVYCGGTGGTSIGSTTGASTNSSSFLNSSGNVTLCLNAA